MDMTVLSPRSRAAILVVAHAAVLLLVWRELGHGGLGTGFGSDAAGFRSLVVHRGRAYRDFTTAYPPLALGFFKLLGPANLNAFVRHLIVCNVAAHVLITYMCFLGWGRRAAMSYLALSLPLMPFLYYHYDLLGAACAVAGTLALVRRREGVAAGAWVAGAFLKIWPVVLLPRLLADRKPHAFVGAVAAGVVGLVGWVAWGGTDRTRPGADVRRREGLGVRERAGVAAATAHTRVAAS